MTNIQSTEPKKLRLAGIRSRVTCLEAECATTNMDKVTTELLLLDSSIDLAEEIFDIYIAGLDFG